MASECEYCGQQPNHGCECFKIKCENCGKSYYEATVPRPKPSLCAKCYCKVENAGNYIGRNK